MTMHSATVAQLKSDYPDLIFTQNTLFSWSHESQTLTYPSIQSDADLAQLLHEVSHAILGHAAYRRDITLLDMERQAWTHAVKVLAPQYKLCLSAQDAVVQDALDSYREWLHARSTCPHCSAVGIERNTAQYQCLVCRGSWTVNEARTCRLQRYKQ